MIAQHCYLSHEEPPAHYGGLENRKRQKYQIAPWLRHGAPPSRSAYLARNCFRLWRREFYQIQSPLLVVYYAPVVVERIRIQRPYQKTAGHCLQPPLLQAQRRLAVLCNEPLCLTRTHQVQREVWKIDIQGLLGLFEN